MTTQIAHADVVPTIVSPLAGIRSYRYIPGHCLHEVEAALQSEVDAIVLDLEDLVPLSEKVRARQAVATLLQQAQPKPVLVRINGIDSAFFADDIAAVVGHGLTALRIPKAEHGDAVRHLARLLEQARVAAGVLHSIGLQLMIESAAGLEQARSLARASHLVWSLGLGEGDFCADLHVHDDEGLLYARSRLVAICRAAGLPGPVQVTFPPNASTDLLQTSTARGRRLGFSGRTVIAAAHAATVNALMLSSHE